MLIEFIGSKFIIESCSEKKKKKASSRIKILRTNLSQRFFKQKIKLYRLMTIFLKLDTINVDAIVYTI